MQLYSLWYVHWCQPIGLPYFCCSLDWIAWQLCHVWFDRMKKYKRYSFFVRYGQIQNFFNEWGVRLKAHTSFVERVLYFPISHTNEHRLHISYSCSPVLKLMIRSSRKMVSDTLLKTIQRVLRSSLKKEMATGKMMRLAMSRMSMNKSQ